MNKTMRTSGELIDEALGHVDDARNAAEAGHTTAADEYETLAIVKGLAAIASALERLAPPVPPDLRPSGEPEALCACGHAVHDDFCRQWVPNGLIPVRGCPCERRALAATPERPAGEAGT